MPTRYPLHQVLRPGEFTAVTRADGTNQTAYMGRPLYYFAGDAKPGDVNGEGFNSLWYVANVSGMMPVVTVMPTTVSTTSSAGTGAMGGY